MKKVAIGIFIIFSVFLIIVFNEINEKQKFDDNYKRIVDSINKDLKYDSLNLNRYNKKLNERVNNHRRRKT